jgi:membrane protein
MSQLKERAKKITQRPAIAHLIRANKRFGERLGNQFGAAITYFSVLAMVPILMFAFSVTGFVLVVAAPHLMDDLMALIDSALGGLDQSTSDSIRSVIENALNNYAAIGIIGLVSAIYSGAGWMGNLKDAVRAQWRPSFDLQIKKENFVVKTVVNIAFLIALLILVAITFGAASVSTSLTDVIIAWLGLDQVGWLSPVLRLVPIAISIGAGWLIFMFLYLVLPETREPWKAVRRGSLIGAIGLGVLQYLTSFLIGIFTGNAAAALFGPVIVLMLFFNLFARLILFVAAWIGTYEHPAEPEYIQQLNGEGEDDAEDELAEDHDRQPVSAGNRRDPRGDWNPAPGLVPEKVAARSVQAGMGAGYVVGAATGIGAGSLIGLALSRLRRR